MIKRFLSLIIIFTFCTMQYSFALGNDGLNIKTLPMPSTTYYQPSQQTTIPTQVLLTPSQTASTNIGKGQVLKAFLQNEVSTTDAVTGDPIVVILSEDWVVNGTMIASAGSVINGVISSANAASGWSKDGALQIDFTSMETPEGKIYGLTAEKIDIQTEKEKKSWVKTVAKVGGIVLAAAAVGALIGVSSDSNGTTYTTTTTTTGSTTKTSSKSSKDSTGAIIGASIGAAVALGGSLWVAAEKKGNNITIPANTNFEIVLLENIVEKSY